MDSSINARLLFSSAVRKLAKHRAHTQDCFITSQMVALGLTVDDMKNYTLVTQTSSEGLSMTTRTFLKHKNANWRYHEPK